MEAKKIFFERWNTLEAVPDATIGNGDSDRKVTTEVSDNGQVVLDYLTDIVPSGDAWGRTHSMDVNEFKSPVLGNLPNEERSTTDLRWKEIRNTRFRKSLDALGSFLADFLVLKLLGHVTIFSGEKRK